MEKQCKNCNRQYEMDYEKYCFEYLPNAFNHLRGKSRTGVEAFIAADNYKKRKLLLPLFKKTSMENLNNRYKFRAWDKKNKKMLENMGVNPCMEEICADGLWNDDWNDYEIMQYTGLKDKNRKMIYENDIVKFDGMTHDTIGTITYKNGRYCIPHKHGYYDFDFISNCEIIGNVYEHSHLLDNK